MENMELTLDGEGERAKGVKLEVGGIWSEGRKRDWGRAMGRGVRGLGDGDGKKVRGLGDGDGKKVRGLGMRW